MSQERTEAVVLRGVDFGETSRVVTFLCPVRGKLACLAQGARRPKGALSGLLDTFNRLELIYYWKESRSVQKLGEASLIDMYPRLKSSLEKSMYAAFPLEIAYRAAQENEPSGPLYAALIRGLSGMDEWEGDARTHAAWQAYRLMEAAGYAPDLAEPGEARGFSRERGFTGPGERMERRLAGHEREALAALAVAREACPQGIEGADGALCFELLRRFTEHQFETDFRSTRVIDGMFR